MRRITANLPPRAIDAITQIVATDGGDMTEAIRRGVLTLSYLLERTRKGAELRLHNPDGTCEAVTFL